MILWDFTENCKTLDNTFSLNNAFQTYLTPKHPLVSNVLKLFTLVNLRIFVISQSVFPWQAFPVLLVVKAVVDSLSGVPFGQAPALITNIKLGSKGLARTNTLTYYERDEFQTFGTGETNWHLIQPNSTECIRYLYRKTAVLSRHRCLKTLVLKK